MKTFLCLALAIGAGSAAFVQEREVPKDSTRITLRGCARERSFTVGPRTEDSAANLDVAPGRRFRLSGARKLLDDIRQRERMMVEVTGLVRKADLAGPGGVAIAGGRVRIGGGAPVQPGGSPTRTVTGYSEAVIDVEGFRALAEPCPDR